MTSHSDKLHDIGWLMGHPTRTHDEVFAEAEAVGLPVTKAEPRPAPARTVTDEEWEHAVAEWRRTHPEAPPNEEPT